MDADEQRVGTSPASASSAERQPGMPPALAQRARTAIDGGPRFELAIAMRQVIEAMMRGTDEDPTMQQAAALVAEAASLLRGPREDREYVGVAEGSLAHSPLDFTDFSPFIGPLNPLAPPIAMSIGEGDVVEGLCTYGAAYEGPPGCLHGGYIAGGFDEVLGFAQAHSGLQGMTANLNVTYRSTTPLGREVRYVGRLDRVDGRKIRCSAN